MRDQANQVAQKAGYGVPLPDKQQMGQAAINYGCVPSSRFAASQQPSANDTVTIGGKVFKFVAALGAAVAQVQVLIGGNAAASYANLVDAVNGNTADQGTKWVEATTPFALAVLADMAAATQFRLRMATARGGLVLAGVSGSVALAVSVSGGAAAWTKANLNVDGKAPSDCIQAYGAHTVTAAEVTAGFVDIDLEFQPTMQDIYVTTSAGVLKTMTEQVTLPANQQSIHSTIGTGGTTLIAGDIIYWWAAV